MVDALEGSLQGAGISLPLGYTVIPDEETQDPQGFTDVQSKN